MPDRNLICLRCDNQIEPRFQESHYCADGLKGAFIERVVRLADVLRAIGNMLVIVDCWGNIYRLEMKLTEKFPRFVKDNETAQWNLSLDYDSQTPEVRAFIGSLLGV